MGAAIIGVINGVVKTVPSFLSFLKGKDDNYVQRDKQHADARSTSTTTRSIVLAIMVIFIAIVFWQLAKK